MQRLLTSFLIAASLALVGCATAGNHDAGAAALASMDEPHGVVRSNISKQAQQIFAATIVKIDGEEIVNSRGQLRLTPGPHELFLVGDVNLENTFGTKRTVNDNNEDYTLQLDVEAGHTYYVGLESSQSGPSKFRPIVWKSFQS